jgi:hypothetical protein
MGVCLSVCLSVCLLLAVCDVIRRRSDRDARCDAIFHLRWKSNKSSVPVHVRTGSLPRRNPRTDEGASGICDISLFEAKKAGSDHRTSCGEHRPLVDDIVVLSAADHEITFSFAGSPRSDHNFFPLLAFISLPRFWLSSQLGPFFFFFLFFSTSFLSENGFNRRHPGSTDLATNYASNQGSYQDLALLH